MDSWQAMWRRLDQEGMDACRFLPSGKGWLIEGAAVFSEGELTGSLSYRVCCEEDWSSRDAEIRGWIGSRDLSLRLERDDAGDWTENGRRIASSRELLDIDLGFTPASNTNAIRRLDLDIGETRETTTVWLDTDDWRIKPLRQIYERVSEEAFAYASPSHGYRAELQVNEFGIVSNYPGLWKAERISSF